MSKKYLAKPQKYNERDLRIPVISEIKAEFESLKLFKDEDLTGSSRSAFGFTPSWINYKEPSYSDTTKDELLNIMRWHYPNTLMYFIAVYESRREEDPTFRMINFKRVGPYKAKIILDALYSLSNGLYDPEPEQRMADGTSLDTVKKNICIAKSFGIEKNEILKIVNDIYDKQ